MAALLNKSGADLKKGYTEIGASVNGTRYANQRLYTTFAKDATYDTGWIYQFTSVDETDDLIFEVVFKTPSDWGVSAVTNASIGFYNQKSVQDGDESGWFRWDMFADNTNYNNQIQLLANTGTVIQDMYGTALLAGTIYKMEAIFTSSTRTVTATLYDENDHAVTTLSDSGAVPITFDFNCFGILHNSGGTQSFDNEFEILSFRCSVGTTFDSIVDDIDIPIAALTIKQPTATSFTDLSDYVEDIKVRKRVNASDEATIRLMNNQDINLQYFIPGTEVKVKLGVEEEVAYPIFHGYIPSRPEFANIVHIKGKDRTFEHTSLVTLYGEKEVVIGPASDDYDETDDEKTESSEQEDMFKAQIHVMQNSDPYYQFKSDEKSIELKAFGFISKLTESYVFYDDIYNVDSREIFSAIENVVSNLPGDDITFAGGGTQASYRKFVGDSKGKKDGEWKKRKKLIDEWVEQAAVGSRFPNPPIKYIYRQVNAGKPHFLLEKEADILSTPNIAFTLTDTHILTFARKRYQVQVGLGPDFYWLDNNDILEINSDYYELRGIYRVSEITYELNTRNAGVVVTLDRPKYIR